VNETDLLHAFIARAPYVLPDVRVFRRNIINATATAKGRTWRVRNGVAGQADAYALVKGGMHIEIETKAATGRLEAEQRNWRSFCGSFDVPYLELRAEKDESPETTVKRWVGELEDKVFHRPAAADVGRFVASYARDGITVDAADMPAFERVAEVLKGTPW